MDPNLMTSCKHCTVSVLLRKKSIRATKIHATDIFPQIENLSVRVAYWSEEPECM